MAITPSKKVKEEKPNNCKAIITTREAKNIPPNSPLSYFLSITIPQPKVKIKVPKLLAKVIQRRNKNGCAPDSETNHQSMNKKKRATPKKLKRVGSIFFNVFGNKKRSSSSSEKCWSSNGGNSRRDRIHDNGGDSFGGSEDKRESEVLKNVNPDNFSKSCSLKKIDKISLDSNKSSTKLSSSLSSFFNKRRSKINRRGNSSTRGVSRTKNTVCRGNNIVKEEKKDEERRSSDDELCKKRILMGEKCRPLNASGALHYDINGVLLPE